MHTPLTAESWSPPLPESHYQYSLDLCSMIPALIVPLCTSSPPKIPFFFSRASQGKTEADDDRSKGDISLTWKLQQGFVCVGAINLGLSCFWTHRRVKQPQSICVTGQILPYMATHQRYHTFQETPFLQLEISHLRTHTNAQVWAALIPKTLTSDKSKEPTTRM